MYRTILVWCQDDVDGLEEDARVLLPPCSPSATTEFG